MPRPPRVAPHPAVAARREVERTETKALDTIIRSLLTLSPANRRKLITEVAALDMDLLDPKAQDETPEPPISDEAALAFIAGGPNPLRGKGPVSAPIVVRDEPPTIDQSFLPEDVSALLKRLAKCVTTEEVKMCGEEVVAVRKMHKPIADDITAAYNDALARTKKVA